MTHGILQNSKDGNPDHKPFSRGDVIENTKYNSQLGSQGDEVRRQLSHIKPNHQHTKYPKTKAPSAIHYDEEDLDEYDQQRGQHMPIIEPKTPYQGTAETTEYYDNEEVPEPTELDLGETVNDADASLQNERITK